MSPYRQFPHVSNEKGVALVVALLITSILFAMAITLSYNIASYLKIFASTKEKTQTYYTTVAGAEQLRDHLWNTNCIPPNWCDNMLSTVAATASYQDRTFEVTGSAVPQFGGANYQIYFKDNEDSDNTYASDNDQIVLASIVSQSPTTGSTTTVEAMLIFSGGGGYAQQGGGAAKTSHVSEQGSQVTTQRQTF